MAPRGNRSSKRPPPPARGKGKGKRPSSSSAGDDPFFEADNPKRRRAARADEEVESSDSDEDGLSLGGATVVDGEEGNTEEEEETAGEKKLRLTKEYLERIRKVVKEQQEEEDEEDSDSDDGLDGGRRVARLLKKKQLVDSGRQRLSLAARVLPPGEQDGFRFIAKHRQAVMAVALSVDGDRGFSASKDGVIMHWDIETGKCERYLWPAEKVLLSHHAKAPLSKKRSQQVLALAASSDGRYLATGGMDRHVHPWDVRSREHIQV